MFDLSGIRMIHRALLLMCLAIPLAADAASDAWQLLSDAASALAAAVPAGDKYFRESRHAAERFLGYFDAKMPGYEEIRKDVYALLDEADVASYVGQDSNEGDEATRELVVHWTIEMVVAKRMPTVASTRREQRVKIRMEKRKKKWVIVSFEPRNFFSLP